MRLIDADDFGNRMYHEVFEKDSEDQRWDSGCWMRYKLFERVLREQPTVPQWIPVTERLPDKYTTVIVSCIDNSGDTPFSYTACGYWVGLLPDDDPAWIVDGEVNYHVVAWMPLPAPWKEGQE